jgi:hypothetical protein
MKNIIFKLLIFNILCFVMACQQAQVNPQNIKNKWLDVAYATGSNVQKLDIYLPNESKGLNPVIVCIWNE